ncbi:hypothetical protein MAM1_0208c08018 [Mucor ambiguus]|uniref:Uncharacterized protein n=1 Tax=Mucor ambiguus TaxID=91626 RepID=A0A0C9MLS9_9FUNG|nr:hypothetical protein MAM1_0208c08018 [Mucor ambiguus]
MEDLLNPQDYQVSKPLVVQQHSILIPKQEIDLSEQKIGQFTYKTNEFDSHCGEYVKIARIAENMDLTVGYVHDVIQIRNNLTQKVQHYESGTLSSNFENTKLLREYNRAMAALKESMASLLVADTHFKISHYGYTTADFDYFENHLDQFPCLKGLVIATHAPKYLYENDHPIRKMLSQSGHCLGCSLQCPNAPSFCIKTITLHGKCLKAHSSGKLSGIYKYAYYKRHGIYAHVSKHQTPSIPM